MARTSEGMAERKRMVTGIFQHHSAVLATAEGAGALAADDPACAVIAALAVAFFSGWRKGSGGKEDELEREHLEQELGWEAECS